MATSNGQATPLLVNAARLVIGCREGVSATPRSRLQISVHCVAPVSHSQ